MQADGTATRFGYRSTYLKGPLYTSMRFSAQGLRVRWRASRWQSFLRWKKQVCLASPSTCPAVSMAIRAWFLGAL